MGVHNKNARVRFNGKLAINLLTVFLATAAVVAYLNFWVMLAGAISTWFLQACRSRLRRSLLGSSEKSLLKEFAQAVEQTPPTTPRAHLSKKLMSKASEGLRSPRKKGKCALHSHDVRELGSDGSVQQADISAPFSEEEIVDVCECQEDEERNGVDASDKTDATLAGEIALRDPTVGSKKLGPRDRWFLNRKAPPESAPPPIDASDKMDKAPAGNIALRDPTDGCNKLTARDRWFLNRKPPPESAPPLPPVHHPSPHASDKTEETAKKTQVKHNACATPPRGTFEREIMKLEKKVREVNKLQDRQANGEALEQKQLEKIARGKGLQDLIDKLRIQMFVAELVNKNMLGNASELPSPQHTPETFPHQADFAESDIATELKFPPGLGVEAPAPPPGLGIVEPPPGLQACDILHNSLFERPHVDILADWPTDEWNTWQQLTSHEHVWDANATWDATYWAWAVSAGFPAPWDASACWEPVDVETWD